MQFYAGMAKGGSAKTPPSSKILENPPVRLSRTPPSVREARRQIFRVF